MNFGIFPIAQGIGEFEHGWEPSYLDEPQLHLPQHLRRCRSPGRDARCPWTRFEFECYDVGRLYNLAHFLNRGIVEPPLFVQSVMGILGGIGAHPEDLLHMKRTADRLFGDAYRWSVLGAGRHPATTTTGAALMGANLRVGLEDSIFLRRGVLAESNAAGVERTVRILDELSLQPATPAEARETLGLKGAEATTI